MKRLTNLSPATVTAACVVAAVVGVLAVHGQQMFSPGPLNAETREGVTRGGVRSHAEIGGNCAACHAPPWSSETMSNRCLDCHQEVREQMDRRGPLHGLLAEGKDCRSCHTEHKGTHAALTDITTFDHRCAAFKLSGKHAAVDCKACHNDSFYKGTPQSCVSCHAEPKVHKGRYGTACAQCHDSDTWKATTSTLTKFDHDLTGYRLTGKHQTADCKGCHARVPFTNQVLTTEVFKGTPKTCNACHAEPKSHVNMRYGNNCAYCHATSDWDDVTFRHRFPVSHGVRNGSSTCTTCHVKPNDFQTFTCYGCHAHTPEKEKLRRSHLNVANLDRCTDCHPAGRGNVRRGTAVQAERPNLDVAVGCPEMPFAHRETPVSLLTSCCPKSRSKLDLSDLLTAHTAPLTAPVARGKVSELVRIPGLQELGRLSLAPRTPGWNQ